MDLLEEKLFVDYVERKPRCRAVQVRHDNIWDVANWIAQHGYRTQVTTGDHWTIEVASRDNADEVLFVADAYTGDAIQLHGNLSLSCVPGPEFRRAWEREA